MTDIEHKVIFHTEMFLFPITTKTAFGHFSPSLLVDQSSYSNMDCMDSVEVASMDWRLVTETFTLKWTSLAPGMEIYEL